MKHEITYTTQLSIERWKEYRDLKLEAITTEKIAFSFEERDLRAIPDDDWKKDLKNSIQGVDVLMFAEHEGKLVGMGGLFDYKGDKYKHNVSLGMLYVIPLYRRRGIGIELVKRRIDFIIARGGIKNILCEIFSSQTASLEIHKKLGFQVFGRMKDYVYAEGEYYDSEFMQKQLE